MKEKNFENKVKGFLKNQDAWFVKYWGGGEFTKSGVPDILACVNGYFIGIEVKAPTGRPSELQLDNLKKIDDAGGFGILLYPKDFEVFKELVEACQKMHIEVQMDRYEELKERWWSKWQQVFKSQ
jgi:hypothetical protein